MTEKNDDLFSKVSSFESALDAATLDAYIPPVKFKKLKESPKEFTSKPVKLKGFIWKGRYKVRFDQIGFDKIHGVGQGDRANGKDEKHIEELTNSIDKQIDFTQPVPILKRSMHVGDSAETPTPYALCEGFHRYQSLVKLGYGEWVFDIYDYAPQNEYGLTELAATALIQAQCNGKHKPNKANSEEDVSHIISLLFAEGADLVVEQNEKSIAAFIDAYWPNATKRSKKSALNKALKKWNDAVKSSPSGTKVEIKREFKNYNTFEILNFHEKDGKGYKCSGIKGGIDTIRDEYGYTVVEGTERSYIINAILTYKSTGKKSYFILHTSKPTELEPMSIKIAKMEQDFEDFEDALKKVFGFKDKDEIVFPWRIVGRLPQLPDDGNTLILKDSKLYKPKYKP
jgi:hypothetical protein